ncbi:hypothetical protein BKA69DRAFT_481479 [Paraphysoderma sedebokerense]|nr:hypothetical protein BKA69DRAFT_481479 [Paraphysoderma sedebokerense]
MKLCEIMETYFEVHTEDEEYLDFLRLEAKTKATWGIQITRTEISSPASLQSLLFRLLTETTQVEKFKQFVSILSQCTEKSLRNSTDDSPRVGDSVIVSNEISQNWLEAFQWMIGHGRPELMLETRSKFVGVTLLTENHETTLYSRLSEKNDSFTISLHLGLSSTYSSIYAACILTIQELLSSSPPEATSQQNDQQSRPERCQRLMNDRTTHLLLFLRNGFQPFISTPLWKAMINTLITLPVSSKPTSVAKSEIHHQLIQSVIKKIVASDDIPKKELLGTLLMARYFNLHPIIQEELVTKKEWFGKLWERLARVSGVTASEQKIGKEEDHDDDDWRFCENQVDRETILLKRWINS